MLMRDGVVLSFTTFQLAAGIHLETNTLQLQKEPVGYRWLQLPYGHPLASQQLKVWFYVCPLAALGVRCCVGIIADNLMIPPHKHPHRRQKGTMSRRVLSFQTTRGNTLDLRNESAMTGWLVFGFLSSFLCWLVKRWSQL